MLPVVAGILEVDDICKKEKKRKEKKEKRGKALIVATIRDVFLLQS